MKTESIRRAGLLAFVLAILGVTVLAQRQRPAQSTDVADAATEIRALRAELQEAAAAVVRAQVAVGRLQIAERRMSVLSAQLAEVRRNVAGLETRKEKPLTSLKTADDGIAAGLTGFDEATKRARAELAELERSQEAYREQEAQLTRHLRSAEEDWAALSARVMELDQRASGYGRPR